MNGEWWPYGKCAGLKRLASGRWLPVRVVTSPQRGPQPVLVLLQQELGLSGFDSGLQQDGQWYLEVGLMQCLQGFEGAAAADLAYHGHGAGLQLAVVGIKVDHQVVIQITESGHDQG